MKKNILIIIIHSIIFLFTSNMFGQYCHRNDCEIQEWSPEYNCTVQLFPNCTATVYYQKLVCVNNGIQRDIECLFKINKVKLNNWQCPQLTISELIKMSTSKLLANSVNWSCVISSCPTPTETEPAIVEVWYPSPCWQWDGLNEPSGPPPSIIPCGTEGCCKTTYSVNFISQGQYQPTIIFQQVVGLCNDENCITICE